MIFPSQLKIGQRDRDEGGHNHKHNEGEEQDPKKRIDFMAPDRCEDMVQLDVDGRKGQEACHEELCQGMPVPVLHIRDLICKNRVVRSAIILSKCALVITRWQVKKSEAARDT